MAVYFFEEELEFDLPEKLKIKRWLHHIAKGEGFRIKNLNFIFCNDEYLYRLNVEYLNHNTYTDIITFDNSESDKYLEGDIYISIDRVKENAVNRGGDFLMELKRVMSHGLFHLCGYPDKSPSQKKTMRSKEDQAMKTFHAM